MVSRQQRYNEAIFRMKKELLHYHKINASAQLFFQSLLYQGVLSFLMLRAELRKLTVRVRKHWRSKISLRKIMILKFMRL